MDVRTIVAIVWLSFQCFHTAVTSTDRDPPSFIHLPVSEVSFRSDEEVRIRCVADGKPLPSYRWRKDGVLLTELGLDIKQMVGEGTIVINKPEKYHAGVYQCLAKNDYGTAITQNITLKKAYLDSFPTFLKPNVHRPQVGDSLVLRCNPPKSHPPASVYWGVYKNQSKHNPIINSERISLDPAGNLYFGNVREEDNKGEFLYVCIAQNSILRTLVQGDDQRIIPRVRPGPPTLIPPALLYPMTSNDEAVQGRSKTLKCIFSGFPTPEITWYKNETHEKKFLGKGQELFIQNVTYNDEGHYVCEATSKKFAHAIKLSVYGAPEWRIQPSDVQTSEDETAVFECIAQGRPKPEVHWFIDGEYLHEDRKDQRIDISRSGRLEFRNLTKSDFHVIQCTSKNEYGEILANMKLKILAEPPGFIIEPSNLTVAEDQSAMLHCKVSGAPKPHLMWQKSPQLFILSQDVDNDVYTFHHNGSLEIKKVSKKDQDVYSCYLQNKFGTTVSSSYLNVIDRTRITTWPISQEVNASSDVTFSCSATTDSSMLDKLEIRWLFNDDPIEASNSRYRLENNNELLVLPNVQVGDSGSYTCVAGNGIDEVNKLATLIVKDKPGPPVSVRVAGCSFGTSEITWSQGALNNVPLSSYIVYYNTSYELAYENKFVKACEVKSSTDRCAVPLTPYTNYSFHVVAINELGMRSSPSEFSTDTCSTPQAPPPRHPNKVCTRSQEPGTLVIEWEPMIKAEHYGEKFHYLVVYTRLYSDDNEYTSDEMETLFKPVQTRVDDWRQNELVIQDQPIYHRYNITVEAVNKIGPAIDTPKPVIGFSSQDVPTAIPKNLSIINETLKSTSVRFRWNQIEESDPEHLKGFFVGYRIVFWRKQAPDIKRQKDDIIVKWLPCLVDSQRNDDDHQIEVNEEREMIVDTLWPYSKIVAAVVTLNGAKASEYSDLVYFETPQGLPDKVTMLKVVERASHHIKLSWMAPAEINGEAKGYIIEYKENIDRATSLKTVITDPSQTCKKLYNLKSYTEYVFSVWTLNGAGQSSEASTLVESTTTPSVPDQPMILDIKSGSDYANVSWSPSIKEQKNPGKEFIVEYRKEGDSLWQNTKEEPEHNWYNVTDLEFGVKYEFRVVALNHDGDAMKSAVEEHVIGIHPETLGSKSSYLGWFIPLLVIFLVILIIVLIIVSCLLYKRSRGGNYKVYEKEQLHGVKYDEEATFDEYIRSENSTFRKSKHGSLEGSNKSGSEDDDGSDSLGAYEDVDPTKFNDDGSFVDSVKNTNTLDVDLMNFKNSINMK